MFGCALLSSLLGRRQFNDIVTVRRDTDPYEVFYFSSQRSAKVLGFVPLF